MTHSVKFLLGLLFSLFVLTGGEFSYAADPGTQDQFRPSVPQFSARVVAPNAPVPADKAQRSAVLRPGDIVIPVLPGETSFNEPLQLNKNGEIELPEIGRIALGGLKLDAASSVVRSALAGYFRDLDRFQLRLRERRLIVSVGGYVDQPGTVDLPANASVQTAIAAAGGLKSGAQLDRIKLRRGSKEIVFDYKAYLDSGDRRTLPVLQPLDALFVPASPLIGNVEMEYDAQTLKAAGDSADDGTAIRVFGEVRAPGSFSFKGTGSVVDYIMRAGGVTQFSNVEQIRVIAGGQPQLFNLKNYLDIGDPSLLPNVQAGMTVFVPRETGAIKTGAQIVYVMGEVFKPGPFETTDSVGFLDILANAGGPTRFADTRQMKIMRADGSAELVDLARLTAGGGARELPVMAPGDAIFVPEKADDEDSSWLQVAPTRAIYVMGAVQRPGRYEWSNEMSILDLIAHAGGPTSRADVNSVTVVPKNNEGGIVQASLGTGEAKPIVFNLGKFLESGGQAALPELRAGFTIMVPELPDDPSDNKAQWMRQSSDRSIYVLGAVKAPGRYAFDENFHFLDILSATDGPTADADLRSVRVTHRNGTHTAVSRVNLAMFFQTGDETLLPNVKPGDVIYFPNRVSGDWLDASKESTVRVLGAVAKPGRYKFDDTMTILDLLAEAGGPTSNAYQERIVVVNLSCCKDQAQTFDLVDFAKTGNFTSLPVLRTGDTVYIPDQSQNEWKIFMDGVRDVVQILSVLALAGVL